MFNRVLPGLMIFNLIAGVAWCIYHETSDPYVLGPIAALIAIHFILKRGKQLPTNFMFIGLFGALLPMKIGLVLAFVPALAVLYQTVEQKVFDERLATVYRTAGFYGVWFLAVGIHTGFDSPFAIAGFFLIANASALKHIHGSTLIYKKG